MKTARILITTECHNDCEYCCNKLPEIKKRIKFTTFDEVIKMDYDVYCITGGEPLLEIQKATRLASRIKWRNAAARLYLYTAIPPEFYWKLSSAEKHDLFYLLDGVNYGVHNVFSNFYTVPRDMRKFVNTRLHIQDINYKYINRYLKIDFDWKLWKMNDCETDEDIYII